MFSIVLSISRQSVAVILCCLSIISRLDIICSPQILCPYENASTIEMFVLRTETYTHYLFVTFHIFHWGFPPSLHSIGADMLFHAEVSDGTVKHGTQSMLIQNNTTVVCGQSVLDCQSHTWRHPYILLWNCNLLHIFILLQSYYILSCHTVQH